MDLRDLVATYHRNGISGEGFAVCAFIDPDDGPMLAIAFVDETADGKSVPQPGYVAVLRLPDLVEMAEGTRTIDDLSAWRGDRYEAELRPLLDEALERHWRRQGVH